MGLEAECTVVWRGKRSKGKALLEMEELFFRGTPQLKIRKAEIAKVAVEDGALRVTVGDETAAFELGAAAEKWARALVTTKSRIDKLGVAEGLVVSVVGVTDPSFREEVRERVGSFSDGALAKGSDLVFLGLESPRDVARISEATRALAHDGGLWLVRPKGKGSAVPELIARGAARQAGLVDVKVSAFSSTHTADKYVIPIADRKATKTAAKIGKMPVAMKKR